MATFENVLILEISDLLSYNNLTHDIKVDKYIFDAFDKNKVVHIHFIEDNEGCVREYKMFSEDDEGIFMDYLCEYED